MKPWKCMRGCLKGYHMWPYRFASLRWCYQLPWPPWLSKMGSDTMLDRFDDQKYLHIYGKKWLYSENRCRCNIIYNLECLALNLDHSRINGVDSTLKNTHMQKKIRNLLWKMHILLTFLLYLLLLWVFFLPWTLPLTT